MYTGETMHKTNCFHEHIPEPEMLAFLKKRHKQKLKSAPGDGEGGDMDVSDQISATKDTHKVTDGGKMDRHEREKEGDSFERSLPGHWLHMDTIEKEKMEWMTDVPLYSQNPSDEDEAREVRFSLDGLVIPRNVVLPAHLGLHHHGDEPQVRHHIHSNTVASNVR